MNDTTLLQSFTSLHIKCRYNYVGNTPQVVGNTKKAITNGECGIKRLVSTMVLMTEEMQVTPEIKRIASECLDAWWREQYSEAMKAVSTPH